MDKLWIILLLAALSGAVKGQSDEEEAFPDYWDKDYEDQWYNDELEKLGIISNENLEPVGDNNQEENVANASVETDNFAYEDADDFENQEKNKNYEDKDDKRIQSNEHKHDVDNDYQYEDNRFESKDGLFEDANNLPSNNDGSFDAQDLEEIQEDDDGFQQNDVVLRADENKVDNVVEESKDLGYVEKNEENRNDNNINAVLESPNENKDIFDETRDILADNNENNSNDFSIQDSVKVDTQSNIEDVIDETNKILEETDSAFDDTVDVSNQNVNDVVQEEKNNQVLSEAIQQPNIEDEVEDIVERQDEKEDEQEVNMNIGGEVEDTVDKAYADLNDDLNKLFETWNKLNAEETEEHNGDDVVNPDNVLEYEEKYEVPHGEDVLLEQRDDYENINDSNLSKIFAEFDKSNENVNDESANDMNVVQDDNNVNENNSKELADILKQIYEDENELNPDDALSQEGEKEVENDSDKEAEKSDPQSNSILYLNDALMADEEENKKTEPVITNDKDDSEENAVKKVNVDQLSSSEFDDLMLQFKDEHKDEIDTLSENFERNTAPIHIRLSVDEPVVVTSPNYPSPYPTNNIIDWVFDGEGVGIEFNLTDFAVNGIMGHYLLVKPGGVDESGRDGLIFSYTLNHPRRYRFLDVDRMFVRFEAGLGMSFLRGFQFSVKMISPYSTEESASEPEAILPPLSATLTVNLGGLTVAEFNDVREEFQQIVADIANVYINANQIDPGLNTTSETTQVFNSTLCNINWPNYQSCAEVKFGVPLVYEDDREPRLNEDDLRAMWFTYIYQDPFALRLRRLGVTEFAVPDDGSVMLAWLVIAAGVIISVVMLAFALWRFSCIADYSRMPEFSDSDSVYNEKRSLDLYPTPHQTLPPLYSESEYNWVEDEKFNDPTRVDMGGYANKSYVREELYSLDSDEDDITTRDRNDRITSKDIYKV